MPTLKSTGRLLKDIIEKKGEQAIRNHYLEGELVEVENENGVTSVNVLDENGAKLFNRMWCQLKGETNPTQVWAWGVAPYPGLPVWVYDVGQGYEIFRPKSLEGTNLYSEALYSVAMGAVFNEVNKFTIVDRNYQPGMVIKSPQGGLWVQVYAVRYLRKDGTAATLMPQEIDLTAYLPATANTWAWVLVCIDPVTNALTAVTGDEYAAPTLLTRDLLDDIDTSGLIPLDALKLEDSTSEITAENEFAFGRVLLQHRPKNNYDATAAPTTSDDDTEGYEVGSVWIDVSAGAVYFCSDASTGAAVWNAASIPTVYYQAVAENGTDETQRGTLNFIDGIGTTPVLTDNDPDTDIQVDLDIDALTADGSPDGSTDYVATWDASAGLHKKVLLENLPVSGSVITWTGSYWSPDAAPASASAEDDEFADNSGGLPSGWTEMDFDANTTVNEGLSGLLLTQTTNAGNSLAGIYKALPSGDFTIWTRVALFVVDTAGGQAFRAGIALYEDATSSTGDIAQLTLQYDPGNTGPQPGRNLYSAYNAAPTALGTQVANVPGSKLTDSIYIRVRRNGTNYTTDISLSGVGWGRHNTFTLGFTPAHMGLSVNNLATGETCAALFSFFRYVGSDVGNLGIMNGRRITYYGA